MWIYDVGSFADRLLRTTERTATTTTSDHDNGDYDSGVSTTTENMKLDYYEI